MKVQSVVCCAEACCGVVQQALTVLTASNFQSSEVYVTYHLGLGWPTRVASTTRPQKEARRSGRPQTLRSLGHEAQFRTPLRPLKETILQDVPGWSFVFQNRPIENLGF